MNPKLTPYNPYIPENWHKAWQFWTQTWWTWSLIKSQNQSDLILCPNEFQDWGSRVMVWNHWNIFTHSINLCIYLMKYFVFISNEICIQKIVFYKMLSICNYSSKKWIVKYTYRFKFFICIIKISCSVAKNPHLCSCAECCAVPRHSDLYVRI